MYIDFITAVHTSRNNIAHVNNDIEITVGDVADVLRSYKYYDVLQKDLDMIFKGTSLTVSAKRLFEIYDVKLEKKYNENETGTQQSSTLDELIDITETFKG